MLSTHSVPVLCYGDYLRNPDIPHAWPLLSSRRGAPSKCLGLRSTATTGWWAGYCDACEMTTGMWEGCGRQERSGATTLQLQWVSWSPGMVHYQPVALQHSQPLSPPVLCKCQKQNLCPKQRRAGSYCGPRSLAPTCPTPILPWKSDFAAVFVVRLEYPIFFFLSKPTQQLCPDVLSPRAEEAAKNVNRACENMVMVCVVSCFQVFHLCLLHGGSPPSESLSPSPTLAPPPAPSPVAPIGWFPPLTSRRHSRHCRPHTESSLPHGCPRQRGERMVQKHNQVHHPQGLESHTTLQGRHRRYPSSPFKRGQCDSPAGPVLKTLSFQCRGYQFDPWSANLAPACHWAGPKKQGSKKQHKWLGFNFEL